MACYKAVFCAVFKEKTERSVSNNCHFVSNNVLCKKVKHLLVRAKLMKISDAKL
jgi:hypothetical protein